MKILILESIPATPHLETAGEIALRLKAYKHDVSFVWVGYELPWNEWKLSTFKKILGGSYEKKIKKFTNILFKQKIRIIDDNHSINYNKILIWSKKFNGNLSKLKNYKYDNNKLGAGVASSIISYAKDTLIDTSKYKGKIQQLLYASGIVYERSKKILSKEKPDKIYTFNNRFATCYPIICAAKKLNIKTIRHERGNDMLRFEMYNEDVHSLKLTKKNIFKYWKNNKDKNKVQKAKKFYQNKVNRKLSGYRKGKFGHNINYTKKQIKNFLPNLPNDKRIITFFTSRDYEKASIVGMKFDQLKEFTKLKKIIDGFDDLHLVVRIHPSIENESNNDDKEWKKFNTKNTTIIKSYENYDTYALMFRSDIVVTYTSTIIVESAYHGKPSISLGKFWWTGLNIVHEPNSIKELKEMLSKDFKFKKKNINNCLKTANYWLNYGIKYKYYKPISITKGQFLGVILTWKSALILFLEKIKKIYDN